MVQQKIKQQTGGNGNRFFSSLIFICIGFGPTNTTKVRLLTVSSKSQHQKQTAKHWCAMVYKSNSDNKGKKKVKRVKKGKK